MKALTPTLLLIILFSHFIAHGQVYVDMTAALSNIEGHITIDGIQLQKDLNTNQQIVITAKDMVLNDRASYMFYNVIVHLDGDIIVKGATRPRSINSYVFCRNTGPFRSNKVIAVKNFDAISIADVSYIKNLKGNPEISIYNTKGKRVFKGKKSDTDFKKLPVAPYDIVVNGLPYTDRLLFAAVDSE